MNNLEPPAYIRAVLRRLWENGYSAYLVGGCVRDMIMGRPVRDWDITSSAMAEDVALLFPKTVMTGARFGTASIILPECVVEVTVFRADGEYHDGRRPENIKVVPNLEADLSRRDFTVNAMAVSETGRLIDLFGGVSDIGARVIRCVGDPKARFTEDALRMFRAFRFSAELGFKIEDSAMSAIREHAALSGLLSCERVRDETERTLMSQSPEITGEMIAAGLYTGRMADSGQKPKMLERTAKLPKDRALRWTAFCASLCEAGLIESPSGFLRGMRLDGKSVKHCGTGVLISRSGLPDSRAGIKRLLAEYGTQAVRCAAAAADVLRGEGWLERVDEIIESGECFSINKLAVSGKDLLNIGLPPGKQLGSVLKLLLNYVIEHPQDNALKPLLSLARKLSA